jgi:hypothetical protein
MKKYIKAALNKLPYVRTLYKANEKARRYSWYPPGHFYSPVISTDEISKRQNAIWKNPVPEGIDGIQLNDERQLALLHQLVSYYPEMPYGDNARDDVRYYPDNEYYKITDAFILYAMIRHFKPHRIIEAGSGFSSAVMLDTRQHFLQNDLKLTFIEPYPERLHGLMNEPDRVNSTILPLMLQNTELSLFEELGENDILFIDSTHVSKTGSDLNFLLFSILPRLKSGVLIHFHDVFYPFEYPREWVLSGCNWNEDYFLRAFLMYNDSFSIELFSHYLYSRHHGALANMPLGQHNSWASLWIRKK